MQHPRPEAPLASLPPILREPTHRERINIEGASSMPCVLYITQRLFSLPLISAMIGKLSTTRE
jgi:hypothetical protein